MEFKPDLLVRFPRLDSNQVRRQMVSTSSLSKLLQAHRRPRRGRGISRMPNEILSYIMRLCIPTCSVEGGGYYAFDDEPETFRASLGLVSRHWLQILQSIPDAWSTIHVGQFTKGLTMVRRCLERSSTTTLTVVLFFPFSFDELDELDRHRIYKDLPEIEEELLRNLYRTRALYVNYYSATFISRLLKPATLPSLEMLVIPGIPGATGSQEAIDSVCTPNLLVLLLTNFPRLDVSSLQAHNSLVHLKIHTQIVGMSASQCEQLLRNCGHLKTLTMTKRTIEGAHQDINAPMSPISLPDLWSLEILHCTVDEYGLVLTYIEAPSLKKLSIGYLPDEMVLNRLLCPNNDCLTSLTLWHSNLTWQFAQVLLPHTNLEELQLKHNNIARGFFKTFVLTRSSTPLPKLKRVTITSCEFDVSSVLSFFVSRAPPNDHALEALFLDLHTPIPRKLGRHIEWLTYRHPRRLLIDMYESPTLNRPKWLRRTLKPLYLVSAAIAKSFAYEVYYLRKFYLTVKERTSRMKI